MHAQPTACSLLTEAAITLSLPLAEFVYCQSPANCSLSHISRPSADWYCTLCMPSTTVAAMDILYFLLKPLAREDIGELAVDWDLWKW